MSSYVTLPVSSTYSYSLVSFGAASSATTQLPSLSSSSSSADTVKLSEDAQIIQLSQQGTSVTLIANTLGISTSDVDSVLDITTQTQTASAPSGGGGHGGGGQSAAPSHTTAASSGGGHPTSQSSAPSGAAPSAAAPSAKAPPQGQPPQPQSSSQSGPITPLRA